MTPYSMSRLSMTTIKIKIFSEEYHFGTESSMPWQFRPGTIDLQIDLPTEMS